MSEQNDTSSHETTEQNTPSSAGRPVTPGQQMRRKKSVFQYIAILFAAAFVLLLFTYVMDKRQNELLQQQNQEQINNLQQSVSAVQSLQDLYDENDTLKAQVAELTDQVKELNSQVDGLETLTNNLTVVADKTNQAMDLFWQVNEAFVRGKYTLCRSLIQRMEDTSQGSALMEYLPKESTTDNKRFSPFDRYQEIYDQVF
ncbi:MAG: hypothetical protein AB7E30_01870 [Lawsonibacter sp.]